MAQKKITKSKHSLIRIIKYKHWISKINILAGIFAKSLDHGLNKNWTLTYDGLIINQL